jgi:hypothetical protein
MSPGPPAELLLLLSPPFPCPVPIGLAGKGLWRYPFVFDDVEMLDV